MCRDDRWCECGYVYCEADGPHTLICQTCAKPISGRRRKFCDRQCSTHYWVECEYCDATVLVRRGGTHQRFCSKRCANHASRTYDLRLCKFCNWPFFPHKSNVEGSGGKMPGGDYCSAECRGMSQRKPCDECRDRGGHSPWCAAQWDRTDVYWATCEECGDAFPAPRRGRRICGSACAQSRHYRTIKRDHQRQANGIVESMGECVECGDPFVYWGNPDRRAPLTCGGECSRRRLRRQGNRRRRAMLRQVHRTPYDDLAIFERDGWVCQICRQGTIREQRGKLHPRAPTIDHIVPLSRGGDDAPWNVQCACRACNVAKGAGSAGSQTLLQIAIR